MINTTRVLILFGFAAITNSCGIKEDQLYTGVAGSCTTSMQLDFQICSEYSYRVTTNEDPREETARDLEQNCTASGSGT
jgi:hypothetical protein